VTIQADKAATGAAQKTVALSSLRNFTVPLPPLDAQRQIVADLEAERKLVEANRELIARMEAKIKAKLAEVWGEDGQACGVQPG
jgi:type I restriction enzyme M protein